MKSTHRRNFLKLPLAAAAAQTIATAPFAASAATRLDEYDPNNTKIATMVNARADDNHFLFLKQIGVQWVHVQFPIETNFDLIKDTQDRLGRFGIKIHCGIVDHYRSQKIQLGKPGRDEDIEKFQTFLRDLGRLGIYSAKIDFHPGNTYTTKQIVTSRGYKVREYDVSDFHKEIDKQMFDRVYTADDIWANYTYFIKAVLPVAEKADVRLALHPDDPPTAASAMMNGVAKLFVNYDGYKRADDVAGKPANTSVAPFASGSLVRKAERRWGKDVFGISVSMNNRARKTKIFACISRNVSSNSRYRVSTKLSRRWLSRHVSR